MRSALNQLVSDPRGVFVVLSLAAILEAARRFLLPVRPAPAPQEWRG